jgi:hypothetical protein
LKRWIYGKTSPRAEALEPLLNLLPHHRQQLARLLAADYPRFAGDAEQVAEGKHEIPGSFYAHVLTVFTSSPAVARHDAIASIIINQIIAQIDVYHAGLVVTLAEFVTPRDGSPVRSLRSTFIRNTVTFPSGAEQHPQMLGAETQVGQAVHACHRLIYPITADTVSSFVDCQTLPIGSMASFPVLQANQLAGCLHIISPQPNFFTPALQELLQNYASLLVLAADEDDFYELDQIHLGVMPPREQQVQHLSHFQERVSRLMVESSKNSELLTRFQAEARIWQELEAEFLYLAYC